MTRAKGTRPAIEPPRRPNPPNFKALYGLEGLQNLFWLITENLYIVWETVTVHKLIIKYLGDS